MRKQFPPDAPLDDDKGKAANLISQVEEFYVAPHPHHNYSSLNRGRTKGARREKKRRDGISVGLFSAQITPLLNNANDYLDETENGNDNG